MREGAETWGDTGWWGDERGVGACKKKRNSESGRVGGVEGVEGMGRVEGAEGRGDAAGKGEGERCL